MCTYLKAMDEAQPERDENTDAARIFYAKTNHSDSETSKERKLEECARHSAVLNESRPDSASNQPPVHQLKVAASTCGTATGCDENEETQREQNPDSTSLSVADIDVKILERETSTTRILEAGGSSDSARGVAVNSAIIAPAGCGCVDEEEGAIYTVDCGPLSASPSCREGTNVAAQPFNTLYKLDRSKTKWEEAAIFISEGEDDEKFIHHPRGPWSKKAFTVLHHPSYYITHLVVTIMLMLLVLAENYPTSTRRPITEQARIAIQAVSGLLEFLFLSFIGVHLVLKLIWFGPRKFFTSRVAVISSIFLFAMVLEVIVVLSRQESHIRLTRAFRPVFLLDNVLMESVRREIRDIFKSLKPIFDILFLLIFIVVMFSLFGYFLLAEIDPSYFDGFQRSFVSLYILMTTANNPDVMLESYLERPASVIFFFFYLIITFYFINNMLTAVIYSSFSDAAKTKFRNVYLHKRKALELAYEILAESEGIYFTEFLPLVQYVRPQLSKLDIMCMFKALQKDREEVGRHLPIRLEEFYHFYNVLDLRWRQVHSTAEKTFQHWYRLMTCPGLAKVCHKIIKSKVFKITIYLVVLLNLLVLVIYALSIDDKFSSSDRFKNLRLIYPISIIFNLVYCVEITLKVIARGPLKYYKNLWNVFDSVVVFVGFVLLLLESAGGLIVLAAARPLKLLRLLKLKHKYRDLVWTIVYLVPKLATVATFLMMVNYSFAIFGLEFLNQKVFRGCCNESWYNVQSFYSGNIDENATESVSATTDIYYLLNFDDIINSYVTLFTLTIGNNWHVIMEGFASETDFSWLVRIFFLIYNLTTLVIFEVAIAFFVEAFVYKVLARQRHRYCKKHKNVFKSCKCAEGSDKFKKVKITLIQADLDEIDCGARRPSMIERFAVQLTQFRQQNGNYNISHTDTRTYVGRRLKTKGDIQLQMYQSELEEWIQQAEEEKKVRAARNEKQTWKTVVVKQLKKIYEFMLE